MTQGKHFAALPSKKIHTPKGIARLTVADDDHGRHDRIEPHLTVHGIRPDR